MGLGVDVSGRDRMTFRDRIAHLALTWTPETSTVSKLFHAADDIAYDVIQYADAAVNEEEARNEPEDQVPQ